MNLTSHIRHVIFVVLTTAAASCVSLIGGIGLESVAEQMLPLVPLLIALPALNTTVGDYATILAAHATDPAERRDTKRKLAKALSKTIWINIIGILLLSTLLAWQRGYVLTADFGWRFTIFVVASLAFVVVGLFIITTFLDWLLAQRKIGSDDVLIPIVTSLGDVMMLGMVTLAVLTIF